MKPPECLERAHAHLNNRSAYDPLDSRVGDSADGKRRAVLHGGCRASNTTASGLPNRRTREYMVSAVVLTSAPPSRDGAPSLLWACV
jgi:hypothetical protein